MLLRILRRYDVIALFDAPAEILHARDADHTIEQLEAMRARFAVWADEPNVLKCDARNDPAVTTEILINHLLPTSPRRATRSPNVRCGVTRIGPKLIAMPRVLLLTSHPVQGRDGADKEVTLGLLEHVHDVDFTWVSRIGSRQLSWVKGRRLRILSWRGTPTLLERTETALMGLLYEHSVDLVHVVSTVGSGYRYYSQLRSVLGRKDIPFIHTVPGISMPKHLDGIKQMGTTVAVSRATSDQLNAAGFKDVRYIPNGISLDRWPYVPTQLHPRPVILFAGHTDEGGGVNEVLSAASALSRTGTPVRLVLAMRIRGGRWDQHARAVLKTANDYGLDDVAVHGRVADMPALVAHCDILVFPPSKLVGGKADVPFIVLEAMATGLPVIVTDLPQFDALGDRVVRVPSNDPGALEAALAKVLADPELRERLSREGRQFVEDNFGAELMAQRYRELYEELLQR